MRVSFASLLLTVLWTGACDKGSPSFVDGGVARVLEILDPPGQQIGLRQGDMVPLRVRYHLDDPTDDVLRGQDVHFAIETPTMFDDSGTSTISHDTDSTDGNGIAVVTLSAGNQEGLSFAIRATAPGAADALFNVSVSNQALVTIDAVVSDPLPQPGTRALTAALFSNATCATLHPTPEVVGASRTLAGGARSTATLEFQNLLSRTYAVVGRVTDHGLLVAYGCADVGKSLVPSGAIVSVPVPMYAVSPRVDGTFAVTTSLSSARAERADTRFAPVDVLDRCPAHAAQLLLDALVPGLSKARADAVATARGTTAPSIDGTSTVACYSDASLDAMLGALLDATSPGMARALLVADLDEVLTGGSLASTLSLAATTSHVEDGPAVTRYAATHTADTVVLKLGTMTYSYDLATFALPLVSAFAVGAKLEADVLTIDSHTLTLGVPRLWADAFARGSLAVRVPALSMDTWSAWLAATVSAATHGGKTGCAAVEDLICAETGTSGCAGTIVDACNAAVLAAGATLDRVFDATDAATTLTGMCTAADSGDDLVADRLTEGLFTATGPTAPTLAFSATRTP